MSFEKVLRVICNICGRVAPPCGDNVAQHGKLTSGQRNGKLWYKNMNLAS